MFYLAVSPKVVGTLKAILCISLALTSIVLAACQRQLEPTPNLEATVEARVRATIQALITPDETLGRELKIVVRVDDTRYTMGDMMKILRMMQKGSEFFGQRLDLSTTPFQIPLTLVQREIIARSAPSFGIEVLPEEIDLEIRARLLPAPAEGEEVDPVQLEREFKERYRGYLNAIQFSEAEYRALVEADLEREHLREIVGESVPTVAEQIHLHSIGLGPGDDIEVFKIKHKDGTPWEQLVKEFNQSPALDSNKGDVGWVPRGIFDTLDDLLFSLDINELSEPIYERDFQVFYLVSEKAVARTVDDDDRETLKTKALQDWLDNEWDKFDIETHFTSDDYAWVAQQLGISSVLQQ